MLTRRTLAPPLLLALCLTLGCGSDDAATSASTTTEDMAMQQDMLMVQVDMNSPDSGMKQDAATQGVDMRGEVDMAVTQDMGADMDMAMEVDMLPPSACFGKQLQGVVYNDKDNSSLSISVLNKPAGDDVPFVNHEVRLFASSTPIDMPLRATTDDKGVFCFDGLADGTYVLDAMPATGDWSVSSSSQGKRLPRAIGEGKVDLVFFGDSIPVTYQSSGVAEFDPNSSAILFPTLLREKLENLVPNKQVTSDNIAISGSNSIQWLPGSVNYNTKLKPLLAEADVVVFTLGGNDLLDFYQTLGLVTPDRLTEVIQAFEMEVARIKANIKLIIAAIRKDQPNIDIVWQLYPNYATSDGWQALIQRSAPSFGPLIAAQLGEKLADIQADLAHHEGVLIWDMYFATKGEDISPILADFLHANEAGHQRYARELFYVLGGVEVIEGKVFIEKRKKLGAARDLPQVTPKIHGLGFHQETP